MDVLDLAEPNFHVCFGPWRQTADSLENTLMLGKTEGKRKRGQQEGKIL